MEDDHLADSGTPPEEGAGGVPRRWLVSVSVGVIAPAAVAIAGAPTAVVLGIGAAVVITALGDLVAGLAMERRRCLDGDLEAFRTSTEMRLSDDLLDERFHRRLAEAEAAVVAALTRAAPDGEGALVRALDDVRDRQRHLRLTTSARTVRRARRRFGGLARDLSYHSIGDTMIRYGDAANLPGWAGTPRLRDPLTRIGEVLDDVRLLHSAQIEAAVLHFTLLARLVLVAAAPLLAAVSWGVVPLSGGFAARDIPWALAVVASLATALAAPQLVPLVMRRDSRGARMRGTLLALEVPIAVAVAVATPCWPAVVFAAGWTNWWQRPVFNWLKLAAWIAAVAGSLVVGAALGGQLDPSTAVEVLLTFAAVGVIGGSYGAMLPISISVLARVVVGGLFAPRRARRIADRELSVAIEQLLAAAAMVERSAGEEQSDAAARDAGALRDAAHGIALRADREDRWARRTPLGLRELLEAALRRGGAATGSPDAELAKDRAKRLGDPEPVSMQDPSFASEVEARLRLRSREDARGLHDVVVELALEARQYGKRPLIVRCAIEDERLVLWVANELNEDARTRGSHTGEKRILSLLAGIPGATLDLREETDGAVLAWPGVPLFVVRVSVPLGRFVDDH